MVANIQVPDNYKSPIGLYAIEWDTVAKTQVPSNGYYASAGLLFGLSGR